MRKMLVLLLAALALLCPMLAAAEPATENVEQKPMLRAAIFVQNRGGAPLQNQVESLNDQLTNLLTERGFSVIDKNLVLAVFRASSAEGPLSAKVKVLEQAITDKRSDASVEEALTGPSALRIAQMIGADYLVVASINTLGKESRTFKGEGTAFGTGNQSTIHTLRLSLKVLEASQGGSVYGDTVTASERIIAGRNVEVAGDDVVPRLVESGARKIADRVAGNVERIRAVKVKTVPVVEFNLNSNVEGAVVELDGSVIGSTPGKFAAAPGLHQLRVSKEWLTPWERTVNVTQSQVLNVSLELSEEGLRRFSSIEQLKMDLANSKQRAEMEMKEREAGIGIAKEQSEADAYAKRAAAERDKAKPQEGDEREEGDEPEVAATNANPPATDAPPAAADPALAK